MRRGAITASDEEAGSRALTRCFAELRTHCQGESFAGENAPSALSRNFGGMLLRPPALVLRPRCDADVSIALRSAVEHGVSVCTRGAGHSQSAQGLGSGLLLDMTHFRSVSLSSDASRFEAEAGATWHGVLAVTAPRGLLPLCVTHALDPTVAGTLSVGGIGGESFRLGAQIDHVEYLDIATLDGSVTRCSKKEARELFDAVRGGAGQCGVILRVGYPLRECGPRMTTRCLGYTDAARFVSDVQRLAEPTALRRWLAGAIREYPLGSRRRVLLLLIGDDAEDPAAHLALRTEADFELPVRCAPLWSFDSATSHPFFQVFGHGHEPSVHPWVEHFFSESHAADALARVLEEPPALIGRGAVNVLFVRRSSSCAPLLRAAIGELAFGIGVFGEHASEQREQAAQMALEYAASMSARGGRRYLSGFFSGTDAAFWARHFEDAWPRFCAAKRRLDPAGVLNSGFIDWPDE